MTGTEWILLAIVVVVLLGIVGFLTLRSQAGWGVAPRREERAARPRRDHFGEQPPAPKRPRAAIVVNPTKFDNPGAARQTIVSVCFDEGWDSPLWLETTAEDPGTGQVRQALDAGVDLVCALGGDGTVRTVGAALRGTTTPLGLLPAGTGNLLARNLDLPIDSLEKSVRVALGGRNRRIDVGVLRAGDPDAPPAGATPSAQAGDIIATQEEHAFLVMAGMGFDADLMAGTDDALKKKVGWIAYVVSGAQNLVGPRFKARITTDDETFSRRTRSVIVGNVGKLQGGMALMPDAVVDDGLLDALVLSPRGVVGWAAVGARLATRRHKGHELVTHHATSRIAVVADRPVQLQIDGDPIGKALRAEFEVAPRSLTVRVPATSRITRQSIAQAADQAREQISEQIADRRAQIGEQIAERRAAIGGSHSATRATEPRD